MSFVRDFHPHTGIDFAMPEGTTLRSISDGVVEQVFSGKGSLGNGLSIRMPDGKHAIYGHLSEVKAHMGERIHAGEVIGLSGNTGNSTGPHLHYAMKDTSGHYIDPTSMAEKVANFSGDNVQLGPLGALISHGTESLRDHAAEATTDILLGIFDALKDILVAGTLIGSAVCVILKVAGWRDGGRWAGILIVVRVLLLFVFGGL
jgi:hypothetical protein